MTRFRNHDSFRMRFSSHHVLGQDEPTESHRRIQKASLAKISISNEVVFMIMPISSLMISALQYRDNEGRSNHRIFSCGRYLM